VICLGESLEEREGGLTLDVIGGQLAGSLPDGLTGATAVIAYEPIWAIGTGKIPTLEQITEVHDFIRGKLVARYGDEGDEDPGALRRLGEAVERRGDLRGRVTSTARWSAARASRPTIFRRSSARSKRPRADAPARVWARCLRSAPCPVHRDPVRGTEWVRGP
jgi:hypothetical protein